MTFRLQTLKKRADFLRIRNGRYFAAPGLVLQAIRVVKSKAPPVSKAEQTRAEKRDVRSSCDFEVGQDVVRFGFTATKKLGNAVVRNRTKRRLREAVRLIAPQNARADYEYVLIGRKSTLKRPFSSLLQDLTIAFNRVHGNRVRGNRGESHNNHGRRNAGRPRAGKH